MASLFYMSSLTYCSCLEWSISLPPPFLELLSSILDPFWFSPARIKSPISSEARDGYCLIVGGQRGDLRGPTSGSDFQQVLPFSFPCLSSVGSGSWTFNHWPLGGFTVLTGQLFGFSLCSLRLQLSFPCWVSYCLSSCYPSSVCWHLSSAFSFPFPFVHLYLYFSLRVILKRFQEDAKNCVHFAMFKWKLRPVCKESGKWIWLSHLHTRPYPTPIPSPATQAYGPCSFPVANTVINVYPSYSCG